MTSGGNNFNDFPENQLTKFQLGGKNVTIMHTFAALFQYNLCTAEKRDIWRPGTRDNEAKIRDVLWNKGRLATLAFAENSSTLPYPQCWRDMTWLWRADDDFVRHACTRLIKLCTFVTIMWFMTSLYSELPFVKEIDYCAQITAMCTLCPIMWSIANYCAHNYARV